MKQAVPLFLEALPGWAQTNVMLGKITGGGGGIAPPELTRPRTNQGLSSVRHGRELTARSHAVRESAWSLLPLLDGCCGSKAGASSAHSIRFARLGRAPRISADEYFRRVIAAVLLIFAMLPTFRLAAAQTSKPYGLPSRLESKPYLSLPPRADGAMPPLLSQTGAFEDAIHLSPSKGLIAYDLIVPFWSDGATKSRWIAVPSGASIKFAASGEWVFPAGTVFVKTFELATDEKYPNQKRRLETRLLD